MPLFSFIAECFPELAHKTYYITTLSLFFFYSVPFFCVHILLLAVFSEALNITVIFLHISSRSCAHPALHWILQLRPYLNWAEQSSPPPDLTGNTPVEVGIKFVVAEVAWQHWIVLHLWATSLAPTRPLSAEPPPSWLVCTSLCLIFCPLSIQHLTFLHQFSSTFHFEFYSCCLKLPAFPPTAAISGLSAYTMPSPKLVVKWWRAMDSCQMPAKSCIMLRPIPWM